MDNAILEYKAKERGLDWVPRIDMELQDFPRVTDRMLQNLDGLTMYGAFYLVMIPLCIFMVLFDLLIREKVENLRMGMQLLGAQDNAYWASWIASASITSALLCAEMVVVGRLFKFDVFLLSPPWVLFGLLFVTCEAFISLACFLSIVLSTRSQAFAANFAIIMQSLIICFCLSEPTLMKKIIYNLDTPMWVNLVINIFYLNPCFTFGKMFSDITNVTNATFDAKAMMWTKTNRKFEWADCFTEQHGEFFSLDRYHVPSLAATSVAMPGVIIFYGVLSWYFDQVLPQNRGVVQPWYFPLMPSYWIPCLSTRKYGGASYDTEIKQGKDLSPAETEKNTILAKEAKGGKYIDGVRSLGLSKTYQSMSGGSDVEALKNAFFELNSGQLLGVMGHNGAGKSTMINTLCGLIPKNSGTARMLGFNIDENLRSIRKRMGVVS